MKTTLLLVVIFCTAAAFAQTGGVSVLPSQPQRMTMYENPQHAEHHALGTERPLVGGTGSDTYVYAAGERPVWEFGAVSEAAPLGDVARAVREEKKTAKKAGFVFEKQGS